MKCAIVYRVALTAALLMLLAALCSGAGAETVPFVLNEGKFLYDEARSVLPLVNALRTGEDAWYWNSDDTEKIVVDDLSELQYDYTLEAYAMRRAAELAVYFDHRRPSGSYTSLSENIAYGYADAASVVEGWAEADEPWAGQGHRRNMLSRKIYMGVGAFMYNGRIYWVQEFASGGLSYPDDRLSVPVTIDVNPDLITGIEYSDRYRDRLSTGSVVEWDGVPIKLKTEIGNASGSFPDAEFISLTPSVLRSASGTLEALQAGTATLQVSLNGRTWTFDVEVSGGTDGFYIELNGLMMSGKSVRVVINNPPEGTSYYNYAMEHSYSSGLWGDSFRITYTDFWLPVGEIDPYGFTYPVTHHLYVYAFDNAGNKLDTADIEFTTYPQDQVLVLPDSLVRIDDMAFMGIPTSRVDMQYDVTSIGSRAFAQCPKLTSIRIASSVQSIADDAFEGCPKELVIEAPLGSVAAQFARNHHYTLLPIAE